MNTIIEIGYEQLVMREVVSEKAAQICKKKRIGGVCGGLCI